MRKLDIKLKISIIEVIIVLVIILLSILIFVEPRLCQNHFDSHFKILLLISYIGVSFMPLIFILNICKTLLLRLLKKYSSPHEQKNNPKCCLLISIKFKIFLYLTAFAYLLVLLINIIFSQPISSKVVIASPWIEAKTIVAMCKNAIELNRAQNNDSLSKLKKAFLNNNEPQLAVLIRTTTMEELKNTKIFSFSASCFKFHFKTDSDGKDQFMILCDASKNTKDKGPRKGFVYFASKENIYKGNKKGWVEDFEHNFDDTK